MIRDDTWRRVRDMDQPAECRRVQAPDTVLVPNGNPAWLDLGDDNDGFRLVRYGGSE